MHPKGIIFYFSFGRGDMRFFKKNCGGGAPKGGGWVMSVFLFDFGSWVAFFVMTHLFYSFHLHG